MRSLLTAAAISLAFTLFLTPVFLRLFRKWGWGQVIRTPEDIRNPNHQTKRGTCVACILIEHRYEVGIRTGLLGHPLA